MPYEITVPEEEDEYNPWANRAVLIIDSPLRNDPYDACLEVEVIGIFPDNSDAVQTGPTMAMVALKNSGIRMAQAMETVWHRDYLPLPNSVLYKRSIEDCKI